MSMVPLLIRFISEYAFFLETVRVSASLVNNYFPYHDRVIVECYDTYIVDFHYSVNVWYPQISLE